MKPNPVRTIDRFVNLPKGFALVLPIGCALSFWLQVPFNFMAFSMCGTLAAVNYFGSTQSTQECTINQLCGDYQKMQGELDEIETVRKDISDTIQVLDFMFNSPDIFDNLFDDSDDNDDEGDYTD